jgi:hypothetical protein
MGRRDAALPVMVWTEAPGCETLGFHKNSLFSPAGLAFLAMAQCRLGQHEQARQTLDRLREVSAKTEGDKDEESESLRREIQALLVGR